MKLSKRLEAIASFIESKDSVCDVGCDHGYLDIYLAINKKNKTIIATDISKNVINTTKENLKKYDVFDNILVYCTDGTNGIKEKYDTLVLSGLGAHTIINILNNSPKVKKIIISSNNNWELIRRYMFNSGYNISLEKLVIDNKKIYSVILFIKDKKTRHKLSEILVGKYNLNNKDIYKELLIKNQSVLKRIPLTNFLKRLKLKYIIIILKKYLRKKDGIV